MRVAESGQTVSRPGPRASDGTLLYWIGVNLDIEETKLGEFYLAQGQRLARSGSWAFSAGGFDHWSAQLFKIHGLEPATRAPSIAEYLALVHPEDRDHMAQAIRTMLSDRAARSVS